MILNSTLYNRTGNSEIVRKPLPAAATGSSKATISLHSSLIILWKTPYLIEKSTYYYRRLQKA